MMGKVESIRLHKAVPFAQTATYLGMALTAAPELHVYSWQRLWEKKLVA